MRAPTANADVEEVMATGQALQHRQQCQHDRHRTSQADPTDEEALPPRDFSGARHSHTAIGRAAEQSASRRSQPSHRASRDNSCGVTSRPSSRNIVAWAATQTIERRRGSMRGLLGAVAQGQAIQVDGEKARAIEQARRGEHGKAARDDDSARAHRPARPRSTAACAATTQSPRRRRARSPRRGRPACRARRPPRRHRHGS